MALPVSPNPISFNNVNQELGRQSPYNQTVALNDAVVRTLFQRTTAGSSVAMSDGWGKSNAKIIATGGDAVYTLGDYKIHAFYTSGTFTVSTISDGTMDTGIALANGGDFGSGGEGVFESCDAGQGGGGGMGGNYRITTGQTFNYFFASTGNYTVTIGAGGGGSTSLASWTATTSGGGGGAGGSGGSGTMGGNGSSSTGGGSVSWIPTGVGSNTYTTTLGKGGGGGGGGGWDSNGAGNYSGGAGGIGGGTGGAGGWTGNNGSDGDTPISHVYGGGQGGGGGGGGGGSCAGETFGGNGGAGGPGIVLIRYKFR